MTQPSESTLVLFDIDGTLLSSQGAGREAMHAAGQSLYGEGFRFEGVEVNGRLDPAIWRDLARLNGVADDARSGAAFRERYALCLEERLRARNEVRALPGIPELLARLRDASRVVLGILSGNFPETGCMKLRAGGIDPDGFSVRAWGDDADTRPELVPVARARHAANQPPAVPTERIVVIGDTPHDVHCALANGCRSLAVATGRSSLAELRAAGAHRTVETLADVESLAAWITDGA